MPIEALIERRHLTAVEPVPFPMEASEIHALQSALSREALDILRLVCRVLPVPRDGAAMIAACDEAAASLLTDALRASSHWQLWLFVAHGAWQEPTKLTGYRGLWKSLERKYGWRPRLARSEIALPSEHGVRLAALTALEAADIGAVLPLARGEMNRAALVMRGRDGMIDAELIQLFRDAFPERKGGPETRLRWGNFISSRCLQGEVVVRPGGSWDEREYSVELYGASRSIREIFAKSVEDQSN